MFVKIYSKNGNISMLECDSYTWFFEKDTLTLFKGAYDKEDIVASINKENGLDPQSVWIMNDSGKTVDSYHF